ncbi:hypothetical protein Asi02nite_18380 [Asanoa siamensis]|uniref:Uncharacterized protein n=1 Tax=Asanoa siamensis TaxID=926357 RepID=A0ABQ4CM06_9ACTN|nr:hypothetical protein Asi02nite_18380 [Asanoa siamensis]
MLVPDDLLERPQEHVQMPAAKMSEGSLTIANTVAGCPTPLVARGWNRSQGLSRITDLVGMLRRLVLALEEGNPS